MPGARNDCMPEIGAQGVLLAAGSARRFGTDKLLTPLPTTGEPVALAAARALLAAMPGSLAVVRDPHGPLGMRLAETGMRVVANPCADRGMGTSIACAVRHSPHAPGWVIALADMPWIQPASIRRVAQALAQGFELTAPVHAGRRGHPVAFSGAFRAALEALDDDRGGRAILTAHSTRLHLVEVADPGVLRDVDTPADLRRNLAEG